MGFMETLKSSSSSNVVDLLGGFKFVGGFQFVGGIYGVLK